MADEAAASSIKLTFAAPHLAYYAEAEVAQVNVPGLTGDFGILPAHVPVMSCLKPGVVAVFDAVGGTSTDYFVSSGTVTVNEDSSVQIVAEEAVPVGDLDAAAAKAGLDHFTGRLTSGSEADKAEAAIGVEVHEAILKALGSA
jgi:F-type H+-transporting ATPase subunit delta